MNISCVLLAAGSGRRFGGDKLLYAPDGKSMLLHALELHGALPYLNRILVARPGDERVIAPAKAAGFTVLLNPLHTQGIGTSAALAAKTLLSAEPQFQGVLYGVCDQPYLTISTVQALLDAFSADVHRIVAPAYRGRRGNPVVFPAALLPAFCDLDGDKGGSLIIKANQEILTTISVANETELFDIDTK